MSQAKLLNVIGLLVGFIGTILITLSIKKGKVYFWKDTPKETESGAVFNVWLLRAGLGFLAVGLLIQILGAINT